jgi:glucosyl-3-phosphoglycerate synthase
MPRIVEELRKVPYLKEIVISLARANYQEFLHAKEFFKVLPQEKRIIWIDGERIQSLLKMLEDNGIPAGPPGKGRGVWIAFGYVLATEKSHVIALHDCDIVNYSRELLARLCYPLVHPGIAYEYCKGYYARVTNKMHGRVTRLFITPILRTFQKVVGYLPILVFLDSFRYPLAGEFALTVDLARTIRIPSDWGLEISILGEIFRNRAVRRICQVEICDTYEHKHQPFSVNDTEGGLMKMAIDIAKSLLRTLASEGVQISEGFLRALKVAYLRTALDIVSAYADDAALNGLVYDRHAEEDMVEGFAKCLDVAGKQVLEDPIGTPLIPSWTRVISAIPEFLDVLFQAVEEDNR